MNEFTMTLMPPLSMTAWIVVERFDGLENTHVKILLGFAVPINSNSQTEPHLDCPILRKIWRVNRFLNGFETPLI